jgi:hypothetical protein
MAKGLTARAFTIIAAAGLGLAATTGAAAAAAATGKPCGYSESDGYAWYNHCTNDGSDVWIDVNSVFGPDFEKCVHPGLNRIGASWSYRGAHYNGNLC